MHIDAAGRTHELKYTIACQGYAGAQRLTIVILQVPSMLMVNVPSRGYDPFRVIGPPTAKWFVVAANGRALLFAPLHLQ